MATTTTTTPVSSRNSSVPATTRSRSSSGQHHHSYEERLERVWRSLASSAVQATQRAEHLATETKTQSAEQCKQSFKELDEAVITFLRTRLEYRRQLLLVEAKIEGRVQEMEALESCVRSQPRARKRKRETPLTTSDPLLSHDDQKIISTIDNTSI